MEVSSLNWNPLLLYCQRDDTYTYTLKKVLKGIKLLRRVKHGDPLSPLIFNLIVDELLHELSAQLGVSHNTHKINSMAFADDLILLDETKSGMNHVLEFTIKLFNDRNMSINEKKCFALRTDLPGKTGHQLRLSV